MAAPLIGTTTTGNFTGAFPLNASITHDATGATLLLGFLFGGGTYAFNPTCTYNGVPLSLIGTIAGGNGTIWLWSLLSPATGAHSLLFSQSGQFVNDGVMYAINCTGNDPTTPIGSTNFGTGTTVVNSITLAGANSTCICISAGDFVTGATFTVSGSPTVTAVTSNTTNPALPVQIVSQVGGTTGATDTVTWVIQFNGCQSALIELLGISAGGASSSISESGTAADTTTQTIITTSVTSETGIAADTANGTNGTTVAISETGVAGDTTAATAISTGSITETGTITENVAVGTNQMVVDSAVAQDSPDATSIRFVSDGDALTANDVTAAVVVSNVSSIDQLAASDTVDMTLIVNCVISELGTANDPTDTTAIFNEVIGEFGNANDNLDTIVSFVGVTINVGVADDGSDTTASLVMGIVEIGAANDNVDTTTMVVPVIGELDTANENVDTTVIFISGIGELGTAVGIADTTAGFVATISESETITDSTDATAIFVAVVSDIDSASDVTIALVIFVSEINEVATSSDIFAGGFAVIGDVLETSIVDDILDRITSLVAMVTELGIAMDTVSATIPQTGLYPIATVLPTMAIMRPTPVANGSLTVIPISLLPNSMLSIVVNQISMTEDFSLRVWISADRDGNAIGATWMANRSADQVRILHTSNRSPPPQSVSISLTAGDYYINVLNLSNTQSLFAFKAIAA